MSVCKPNRLSLWMTALTLCLILGNLAQSALPVNAQTSAPQVVIEDLNTAEFPELTLNFRILDGLDQSSALTANQVSVIENGKQLALDELHSSYVGVHFALVINPDRTLVLTYPSGYSNYDRMLTAMGQLGSNLTPNTGDSYSLFINPDIHYDQLGSYSDWKKALDGYKANQKQMFGSLQSLESAVHTLSGSPNKKETVLVYVTPYIEPAEIPALMTLIEEAGKAEIPVHIWMTAAAVVIGSAYQTDLQAACELWGGSLLIMSGSQIPPNPRDYLKGKGFQYSATWQSEIRSGKTQQLGLRLSLPGGKTLNSAVKQVDLEVLPVRMTFVNLPDQLNLTIRGDKTLEPAELPVLAAIEFPDGFPREILSTSLFANGSLVQEHSSAPFGDFVIDLKPYQGIEKLSLQLMVKDALGFSVRSEVKNLTLSWSDLSTNQPKSLITNPWLWAGLGLVMLSLIALIFVPGYLKKKADQTSSTTPSESAAKIEIENSNSIPVKTFGSLIKLDRDNTPSAEKPLLLIREVTLIGKDPQLANLTLSDQALEPLHAEIHAFPDGRIRLTDFHTIAGTYVNYKAVDTKGVEIHHGDILHFGRLAYRFNSPSRVVSPKRSDQ